MTATAPAVERRTRGPWPIYPSLLAAAFILNMWVEADISPYAMFRSLAIGVLLPFVVAVAAGAILRNRAYGGAVAGLMVVALVGWYAQLLLLSLFMLLGLVIFLMRRIRQAPIPWPRVTSILNTFAAALLVALAVKAGVHGTYGQAMADLQQGSADIPPATSTADPSPDIYILLMDAHPRVDAMERLFGYDDEPFLRGLEQRGFDVSRKSRSNYGVTQLTLASMFNMRLLDEMDEMQPILGGKQEAQPVMRNLTNSGTALDYLRQHGYRVFATGSGFEEVALRQAESYIDDGQFNEFEAILIRITGLGDIVDLVAPDAIGDSLRSRVDATKRHTALAVEAAKAGPQLAFIHVPSPHAPILYGADGATVRVDANHPYEYWLGQDAGPDDIRAAYRAQVPYVEEIITHAVDTILKGSPSPPIVIVLSDHGSLTNLDTDPKLKLSERVSNLFAAYTPDHPDLFGDVVTPVNIFPILFNAYFGTSMPRSEDRSVVSAPATLFDFLDIGDPGPTQTP